MESFRKLVVALVVAVGFAIVPTAMACPATQTSAGRALIAANAAGTDPFYYNDGKVGATNGGQPYLPGYSGYMKTDSNTFRFVTVNEQVLTIIGEGKHGLWRIQDNGTVRMYLKAGKTGLRKGSDPNSAANAAKIKSDYSAYEEGDGMNWGHWVSDQTPVNDDGYMNFVDVAISGPVFGGKYRNHVPIDLPSWYCTMSEPTYPNSADAMHYAFKQKGANVVGPLGKRAGLDIKELYTNVLRLDTFPDARSWVNVGTSSNVHWEALDESKTKAEYYFVERPFFNVKYLFVMAVYDNTDNRDFQYVRPHGAYYESLIARGYTDLKTTVTLRPSFATEPGSEMHKVSGTNLFGVHHVDRPGDNGKSGGGACPMRGGDWDDYPSTTGGAGWPTQYQEITPLCDGVLVDIKFYANLDGATWDDESKYLPSNPQGSKRITYKVKPGVYGNFTDPYFTDRGIKNPGRAWIPARFTLTYRTSHHPVNWRR